MILTKATKLKKLTSNPCFHCSRSASAIFPTWPKIPWLRTRPSSRPKLDSASLTAFSPIEKSETSPVRTSTCFGYCSLSFWRGSGVRAKTTRLLAAFSRCWAMTQPIPNIINRDGCQQSEARFSR